MSEFLDKYIKNRVLREIAEWVLALLLAIIIYLFLQTFLFRTVNVKGISMEPAFLHGERLVLLRPVYWFSNPDYGDVVAFPYKADPKQKFIKRIIGLPGDVIDLVDYQFTVNSEPIDGEMISSLGNESFPMIVPENCYFVLGDNRNASKDSRYQEVGCIPKSDILGKAVFRFWPISSFGVIGGE